MYFLILNSLALAQSSDSLISVNTVEGKQVFVSKKELLDALASNIPKNKLQYAILQVHSDGYVDIGNFAISIAGTKYTFESPQRNTMNQATYACRSAGFKRAVKYETSGFSSKRAFIDEEGYPVQTGEGWSGYASGGAYSVITCQY